jgi:protein-ribulosamine 3-kinase
MKAMAENTTQGSIPLITDWDVSWESFFTTAMKHMMEEEEKTQGPSKDIEELKQPLLEKVIPRLLRPLEGNIKPCLVHGDLWHGNTSVAAGTDEPYAFDACVLWAHNECKSCINEVQLHVANSLCKDEMGIWRAGRYKFGRPYLREYHRHVPVSAPEADWDDRNALYGM